MAPISILNVIAVIQKCISSHTTLCSWSCNVSMLLVQERC